MSPDAFEGGAYRGHDYSACLQRHAQCMVRRRPQHVPVQWELFSEKPTKAKGKPSDYTSGILPSETRTMPEPHLARTPLLQCEIGLCYLLFPASQASCRIAHPSAVTPGLRPLTALPKIRITKRICYAGSAAGGVIATAGQEVHK